VSEPLPHLDASDATGWCGWLRRLATGSLACLLCLGATAAEAIDPARVLLVREPDNPRNLRVAQAFHDQVSSRCDTECARPVEIIGIDATQINGHLPIAPTDLVVSIGSRAAQAVARQPEKPTALHAFIPRQVWRELGTCCTETGYASAIFIDQPMPRLMRLIAAVAPQASRVGTLLGPASHAWADELASAAVQAGFALETREIVDADELGSRLRLLTARNDVLLALPDATIYNRNTVYPVLLTSYSARVPVIGFSAGMVTAGAAAAAYMSPEDAGSALFDAVQGYLATGSLPPAGPSGHFSVAVNEDVLRSLRLPPLSAKSLRARLKESQP
jgi:ABC-type uncharacterized transport system substrate-binding protein